MTMTWLHTCLFLESSCSAVVSKLLQVGMNSGIEHVTLPVLTICPSMCISYATSTLQTRPLALHWARGHLPEQLGGGERPMLPWPVYMV